MKDVKFVTGVDIGGSHITAALIDVSQRKIIGSTLSRLAINAGGEVDEIISTWSKCISAASAGHTVDRVCLAMPGPFDYKNGIFLMHGQAKYEKLFQLNIKELLGTSLHLAPEAIHMDNDAACFLHGEIFGGSVTQYGEEKVIGITLGTGLGSAVYNKGHAYSADLWDLPFHNSIAEEYLSTRWFLKRFAAAGGQTVHGVKDLARLAATDQTAAAIFNEFGKNLAAFLLEFIHRESPKAIVIGGNISKAYKLFGVILETAIHKDHPDITIHLSSLGEEASLLGAAGSWHTNAYPANTIFP